MKTFSLLSLSGMLLWSPPLATADEPVAFRKLQLTDKYYCDGINQGDFNRDGHTDIVASSHLSSFSRADGTLNNEAFTGLFYYLDTIAYDAATQQVFFPDPSGGGIRVFDALTDAQLTTVAVPTGLAPVDLVVARSAAVDAPLPAPGNNRLSVAAPNPTASATTIRLHRPAQQVRADILDVRGTVVRTLEGPPLRWDGRRADGRPAPAGVYFYRLRGDVEDRGRVVILR